MNKILTMGLVLFAATSLFTACADDRDSNPTLVQPTEFVLNTPVYANQLLDLRTSKHVSLTWSQPNVTDKGAPLAGVGFYAIQVSKDGKFTASVAEAAADKTGKTVADYIELEEKYFSTAVDVNAEALDKAINTLFAWESEDNMPAKQELHLRVYAHFAGTNAPLEDGSVSIASNVVKVQVAPYYIELSDAPVALNYIVGQDVAGSWSNNVADAGKGLLPFFPIANANYDKKTGLGSVSYTGYFADKAEFKVFSPKYSADGKSFAWDYAYVGVEGTPGTARYRDGGDDGPNITAPKAGYYTIVIDNVKHTFTMTEATEIDETEKGSIGIVGEFSSWDNDVVMTAASTAANAKNHVWTAELKLEKASEVKFRANAKWDLSWGSATVLPYGVATKGGPNMKLKKGTYKVYFNDLTGQYNFIQQTAQ
ncbi:SusF/SusE family outer membrane protein [Alloprevotella sp. oral taxon 473]|jgi:hypothetical protein|uniref:SusF/SusE family outer membrane protein n=1 Tax=Alloprevotella sp. oral taxon 473 TaxID=712469 RepID=UPI0002A3422E|nr:SusF/SusE family outer membrane protein [Alloprevotella sp. oral taxon 473]EKX88428.1 hypothetical protein HMPREF9999_01974 [Alloprevotella sp. oral taxon 473 str. F0040]